MGLNGLTLRILARWAEIAPLYRCATTTYMPPHPILYLRPKPQRKFWSASPQRLSRPSKATKLNSINLEVQGGLASPAIAEEPIPTALMTLSCRC